MQRSLGLIGFVSFIFVACKAEKDCLRPFFKGYCSFDECPKAVNHARNHEKYVEQGAVFWRTTSSVGNYMMQIRRVHWLASDLQLGLFLDYSYFPSFLLLFEPNLFDWTVPPTGGWRFSDDAKISTAFPEATHTVFKKWDGFVALPRARLEELGGEVAGEWEALESVRFIAERYYDKFAGRGGKQEDATGCGIRAMFRRTLAADMYMQLMRLAWGEQFRDGNYVAWQIRTPDGEDPDGYNPKVHTYIHTETPEVLCQLYPAANDAEPGAAAGEAVFLATNSMAVRTECYSRLSGGRLGFVPTLGLHQSMVHTGNHSHLLDPRPGFIALLDFLFVADASAVVFSSSSLVGSIITNKGWVCADVQVEAADTTAMLLKCAPGAGAWGVPVAGKPYWRRLEEVDG